MYTCNGLSVNQLVILIVLYGELKGTTIGTLLRRIMAHLEDK